MKRFFSIAVILVILAAGAFAFWRYRLQQRSELLQSFQTEPASTGSLTATVGATGIVRSEQTAVLVWRTSGTVEKVRVSVGDEVEKGRELAVLAQTSLPQNVIMAQAELVSAQEALDDLLNAQIPKAQALRRVEEAQMALDELHAQLPLQQAQAEVALLEAQRALDAAERQRNALDRVRASDSVIEATESTYLRAQKDVDEAQKAFDKVSSLPPGSPRRAAALIRLLAAERFRDNVLQKLNWYTGTPTDQEVAQAEANLALAREELEEARREWERLMNGPGPENVALLEAELADAQREWEQIKDGPTSEDIAAAEARIAAARATLDLARLQAPFAATVTDIQIEVGDQVIPEKAAFRLDDLSRLLVDVEVSEVDINAVQVGQPVILTFDAILGREYEGMVREVSMVGTLLQGAVSFDVTVEILNADEAVKPGMTAAVNITVSQLAETLLVPNQAVRVREGKEVVYVLKDDVPEPVEISLGASSETLSEVIDGDLEVGDLIVLNPPPAESLFSNPPGR